MEERKDSFFYQKFILRLMTLWFLVSLPVLTYAQDNASGTITSNKKELIAKEFGLFGGYILPKDIDDVEEILPMWGIETAFRLETSMLELGVMRGGELGVTWLNAYMSLRFDLHIEQLVIYSMLGIDYVQFEDAQGIEHSLGAGHIGGGVMTPLSDDLWFKVGLKFNIRPGTSLYIGGGFVFRFGPSKKDPKDEKDDKDGAEGAKEKADS